MVSEHLVLLEQSNLGCPLGLASIEGCCHGRQLGGTEAELLGGLLVTLGIGEQRQRTVRGWAQAELPKGRTVSSPLKAGANT